MLTPYRVLDLTDSRAALGPLVMAGFGCEVIKVEPPEGCPSRREAPLDPALAGALASLRFHVANRGKKSVVVDLETASGRRRFRELVESSDFLFENAAAGAMAARGLGFEHLRQLNPELVHVAITPFGQDGPYAQHRATDLTLAAMGGAMALNGEADRRPLRITVPQTWHHAAVESVVGALVAHQRRLASGAAQFVDVSVQAAVFWTGLNAMIAHAVQGRDIERSGTTLQLGTVSFPLVYPCADGEVVLITTTPTLRALVPRMLADGTVTQEWVDAENWATYEMRLLTGGALVHSVDEMQTQVRKFCLRHKKADLFALGIEFGATLAPVNTIADALALEHLAARGYWQPLDLPDGRTLRAPGAFAKVSGSPVAWPRRAPALGEHDREILDAPPRKKATATKPPTPATDALPFAGLKVADFSWIGVGPITAKYFADHGATVVHVETEKPADRLRVIGPFKDGVPGGVNRSQFFASFNTSKLSLAIDLKTPEGREIAERLIRWADVSLDSFTPGTMADFGLGIDVIRQWNPSIVTAGTCLMGQTGPASALAGYGYHAAAICGFYEITGWDDRAPAGPYMAYTDTVAPRFLAATIMAALDHRRRTGEGRAIDQSQMEASLHFLASEIVEQQVTGRSPRRAGNDDAEASPHDVYPCAGDDEWCAIVIENDEQWGALKAALGDPEWARDAALDSAAGRRERRALVDRELAAFTAGQEPRALMERLQAAGVPAGMVQRSSDHQEDPQLRHRRFFRALEHGEMGTIPYEGHAFRITGYDGGPRSPAPCLGEHSIQVLQELLGYDDEDLARLASSGALR